MEVLTIAGEDVRLLAQRAAWWPRRRTLLVADMHLGKAAAFRAAGVPVPEGGCEADLARLGDLIDRLGAERVVVLGDLLHARSGRTAEVSASFAAWRGTRPGVRVMLVRGNHDAGAGDPAPAWGIECVDGPWVDAPFVYRHEPGVDERGYVLCGHVHPGIVLRGAAGTRMRVPCYWMGRRVGVLPAFGSFTGMKVVQPVVGDRVYAVSADSIMEVSSATVEVPRRGLRRGHEAEL